MAMSGLICSNLGRLLNTLGPSLNQPPRSFLIFKFFDELSRRSLTRSLRLVNTSSRFLKEHNRRAYFSVRAQITKTPNQNGPKGNLTRIAIIIMSIKDLIKGLNKKLNPRLRVPQLQLPPQSAFLSDSQRPTNSMERSS